MRILRRIDRTITAAAITSTAVLALLAILVSGVTPGLAAAGASAEVTGTVTGPDGEPLEAVIVEMAQIGIKSKPFKTKTRKDGTFKFPFLPYHKQDYDAKFVSPGFMVRKVKILSRQPVSTADRLGGMIVQEDSGTIDEDQKIPSVVVKPSGIVEIEIGMVREEFFGKLRAQKAAAKAAQDAAERGEDPAAAAGPADVSGMKPLDAARQLSSSGDHAQAVDVLKASIAEEPSAELWFELARAHNAAGDTAEAMKAAGRAAGLDPAMKGVHYFLGGLYADGGRLEQAISEVEQEVELAPDVVRNQRTLGSLYSAAGRDDEALATYEKLQEMGVSDAEILSRLGNLYSRKGDFAKAKEYFEKLEQENPEQADQTHFNIGVSIMNQNSVGQAERKEAASAFRRALEANPKHAQAHLQLAYALLGLGNIPEAKVHMKEFVRLAPNSPQAAEIQSQLKELG